MASAPGPRGASAPGPRAASARRRIAAAAAALRHPRSVYYGWWLLAGSVVAMALGSGVSFWAFGLYVEPFEDDFGWSRAEVSFAFSIALLSGGVAGRLIGRWIDMRGPREVILVGAVMTALSYALLTTSSELWQWYAFSAVNGVFRQMMFFIPFQALISRWFARRRAMALSILGTGFSLGGVVVVPAMRLVIDSAGWQASPPRRSSSRSACCSSATAHPRSARAPTAHRPSRRTRPPRRSVASRCAPPSRRRTSG